MGSLPFQPIPLDATPEATAAAGADEATRKRLDKMQWQNRGLIVYSVICTVMVLYLLLSVFLAGDHGAISATRATVKNAAPAAVLQVHPTPAPAPAAAAPATTTPAPAPEASSHSTRQPGRFPGHPKEKAAPSSAPASATAISSDPAPAVPPVEYVGSITSDKYHYRSCKWAKYIIPGKRGGVPFGGRSPERRLHPLSHLPAAAGHDAVKTPERPR